MASTKKQIPTVSLEKSILNLFLTSKVVLQSRFQSSTEQWFTSDARLDLYRLVEKNFESSRSPISSAQMDYLIDSSFPSDEARRKKIKAEYNDIIKMSVQEDPNTLIFSLNDALRSQEIENLIMSAYRSLQAGDSEEAYSKLKQGTLELRRPEEESRMVSLWDDTEDWVEEIENRKNFPELYAGIPTGFERFDKMTGGLFPAELTVVFGLSGKGKSTLMKQIGVNVRKAGYNVLHCGNEEDKFQMRTKYTAVETGINYSRWKRGAWTDQDMRDWEKYRDSQQEPREDGRPQGKMFVYNFPQQTDATMIERKLAELKEMGVKIDLVIVDYLDLMSSIKRAYNENDEGGRVTGDLKQIAINFHVPVLVCTQANTSAERQEMREKPFLTAADVFGTKRKVHSANVLMGIVNQTATVGAGERDDDVLSHRLVICVPKNRDGGVFTFRLIMQVKTGRVIDDDGTDQAGEDQEKAAQEILNEYVEMDKKATAEEQRRAQAELKKNFEDEVQDLLDGIPTVEDADEERVEKKPATPEPEEEPGIREELPDVSFFEDGEDDSPEPEEESVEEEDQSSSIMSSILAIKRKK